MATLATGSLQVPALAVVVLGLALLPGPSWAQPEPELDARIELLWPHGGADVLSAERANITVYLFERGSLRPYCPDAPGTVGRGGVVLSLLYASGNDATANLSPPGTRRQRRVTRDGLWFYAWDFDDLDVAAARDPRARLYFVVRDFAVVPSPYDPERVGGRAPSYARVQSNVWAHAADARTYYPQPELPTGVGPPPLSGQVPYVDPKIQVVWPHGGRSVTEAERVNITATVFLHGGLWSIATDYAQPVQLYQALNQEILRPVAVGQKRVVTANGVTYPVWDFNNIDVSAARDPRNKYFFQVKTSGSEGSNVWVHGADGRTYFPEMDVPERGCP